MIPKKLRRTIVVNDATYEYCVTGSVNVYIKNLKTNETIEWWMDEYHQQVKPSDIRELILMKEVFGIKAQKINGKWIGRED